MDVASRAPNPSNARAIVVKMCQVLRPAIQPVEVCVMNEAAMAHET